MQTPLNVCKVSIQTGQLEWLTQKHKHEYSQQGCDQSVRRLMAYWWCMFRQHVEYQAKIDLCKVYDPVMQGLACFVQACIGALLQA